MAEPEFDRTTGWWFIRYRTAKGTRAKKTLMRDPRWARGGAWPPKGKRPKLPADVDRMARPFKDADTRVRLGHAVKLPRSTDLAGFLERYLVSYRLSKRANSAKMLEKSIGHFLKFCAARGIVGLEAVGRATCRDFIESRRAEGRAFYTVAGEKGLLGGAWSRAVEDELIDANPWHKLPIPGENESEGTPHWTAAEVEAILAHLKGWVRDAFIVGVNSGFRIKALLNLQWRDVRWVVPGRGFGLLDCRKELSKNRKPYSVPLFAATHDVLARRLVEAGSPKSTDPVFPGRVPGRGITRGSFAKPLIRAIKAAGVEYKGHECHAMRATFATLAAARGVNPRALQAWLSHSSLKMTDKYVSHTADSDDVEAAKVDAAGIAGKVRESRGGGTQAPPASAS